MKKSGVTIPIRLSSIGIKRLMERALWIQNLRIYTIKTNLQKGLGVKISVDRDTKNNTSIIKIEKNNSGNSSEHKISPENERLSPYLNALSPVPDKLSPEDIGE